LAVPNVVYSYRPETAVRDARRMNAVTDHYTRLLAPIYLWMAGGPEAAVAQGSAELSALSVARSNGAPAIDLGAGFGMHAIPLARLGYAVMAIDSSTVLLAQLQQLGEGLGIRVIEADLLDFAAHLDRPPALILCMGDTLTHLSSSGDVELLCSRVAVSLAPGGRFVTTFRDYIRPARGDARFIPVRSDANRIHTCFLEEEPDRMLVHDIEHERQGGTWSMRVSRYPKLRLDPDVVVRTLEQHALEVARERGPRGMVQIVAVRRS
jgi:SAM-dependent methyltransferase